MTREQLQAAADEIRAVCKRRGVVLYGTCDSEGIYGEIAISGADDAGGWLDWRERISNIVIEAYGGRYYYATGIGDAA